MATKTFKIGLSNTDKQNMAQDVYERVLALTFAEYDSANTYNKGDFVVYDDTLYQCKQDNTTGAWDSSKWQQATLQDLLDDIEGAVAFVNDKANVDGNYPTMTVGAADNLTPYDEDSGVDQEQPFLLQGTGCGNGEQQVDTGALGLLKSKNGNSVVVNQKVVNGTFENTDNWNAGCQASMSVSNNIATVTASASGDNYMQTNVNMVIGHKYLLSAEIKTDSQEDANNNASLVRVFYGGSSDNQTLKCNVYNQFIFATKIITCISNQFNFIRLENARSDASHLYKNVFLIDLTQWFGSNDNIPAHLLSHPEDFFRYYQGSLEYNEGTLVNSNGRYLKTFGRNQFNKATATSGKAIDNTGTVVNHTGSYVSTSIKVIPNETYYFKDVSNAANLDSGAWYDKDGNFIELVGIRGVGTSVSGTAQAPSNAVYLKVCILDESINTATISIYYDGESGYDQYYPYEELANIDTGTETLRSAGSVKDSKAPDGTITRRIGSYTFTGEETWTANGEGYLWNNTNINAKHGAWNRSGNMICQTVSVSNHSDLYNGVVTNGICIDEDGKIAIGGDTYTDRATLITGKTIFFELATPTIEQGTTFSENVAIDDFGSMDFGGTNGVPQGASIFYAVDYKAFIDSLYNTLDGDATDIVKESELDTKLATLGYVKLTSVSGYDATKTQVLKNVEGTLTWVTEE